MSSWLCVGSGPSAPERLERFLASSIQWSNSITCNAGIKLWPYPDYFLCVDMNASRDYEPQARAAQAQGTKLVTLDRECSALQERRCDFYDVFLNIGPKPREGGYGHFRYSGPLMLEIALNHGASELHLIGFDGYAVDRKLYFDQEQRSWSRDVNTTRDRQARAGAFMEVAQPALRDVCAAWPNARFLVHGPTLFQIDSPNWSVLP